MVNMPSGNFGSAGMNGNIATNQCKLQIATLTLARQKRGGDISSWTDLTGYENKAKSAIMTPTKVIVWTI